MILVTGGAGFMGRHVVQTLLAEGRGARVLDLQPWPDAPPGVEVIQASIRNEVALNLALRGVEGVIHLAALSSLWTRHGRDFDLVNAEAAGALAAQAKAAGVKRFLYVSSHTTLISGKPGEDARLDETADPPPEQLLGPYPRAKRRGEALCLDARGGGLEVVVAIPTLPFGPGDVSRTAPTRLLIDLARGRLPALLETRLDLVDVRDLARSLVAALDRGRDGARYILGGHDVTMGAFSAAIARATGRRPVAGRVNYGVALAAAAFEEALGAVFGRAPGAPLTGVRLAGRPVQFDSRLAARELGHASRPFEESLRDALDWAAKAGLYRPAAG